MLLIIGIILLIIAIAGGAIAFTVTGLAWLLRPPSRPAHTRLRPHDDEQSSGA